MKPQHTRRSRAVLLLFLTLAPWALWAVVVATVDPNVDAAAEPDVSLAQPAILGTVLAALLTIGLMIFYVGHLYSAHRVTAGERALWLALIVFANIFAMPFYWYRYFWLDEEKGVR